MKLSLLSKYQDGIICPASHDSTDSTVIVFACKAEVVDELYYKLSNNESESFYSSYDSKGKHSDKNISVVMGLLKFHIKLIVINKQPFEVMMLIYHENSNLSMDKEISVQCVIKSGSETYTDDMKLKFSAGIVIISII